MFKMILPYLLAGLAVVCGSVTPASAGELPRRHWATVERPADAGWSEAAVARARAYADTLDTAAVFVVEHGRVVTQWGEPASKFNIHSIRKSLLSGLYGIAVARREVDTGATLEDLDIDDNAPSLTPLEKQARVIDLLKSRSGIYHPALYESPDMKARKPQRGAHPPRTFWYYNNWDFNALGTIYEQQTKTQIGASFAQLIAAPLQMEDFDLGDARYVGGQDSIHRAYPFRMSARDLARVGLLYLHEGRWRGRQIIPRGWVKASTTAYSIAEGDAEYGYSGYGYMWWVAANGNHFPNVEVKDGAFSARGVGGHFLVVMPDRDLVVVHRVNTDEDGREVTTAQFGTLLRLLLDAQPKRSTPSP